MWPAFLIPRLFRLPAGLWRYTGDFRIVFPWKFKRLYSRSKLAHKALAKRTRTRRKFAINLCRLALGGQTVKNLPLLASKFELDQSPRASPRKSSQVDASPSKWVAKRNAKLNAKLASTCESVWPGL